MATYEPVLLSNPIFDEVEAAIKQTYPNACILWVDEVINPELRKAYEDQRESLRNQRGSAAIKELGLYHGTSEEAVYSIANAGFDPSKNITSAFGKGTYFAVAAAYSKNYAKPKRHDEVSFMMMCDVLVGKCCKGSSNSHIKTALYDNSVDNATTPSIYVTPYKYGAYPKYIIAFHRNAA
jgi:hypothetical protein